MPAPSIWSWRSSRRRGCNRYHKPQDDIGQPIDFAAALAFNRFCDALTANIADAPQRPALLPAATDGHPPGR